VQIRDARDADVEALTRLWHAGWQDAHASVLPEALVRVRTYESFRQRMEKMIPTTRVAFDGDAILGFTVMKGDELDQLYVAAEARGTGAAQGLIADAEQRHAATGAPLIWLACAIGNNRAARFYEKSGWRNAGVQPSHLPMPDGSTFTIEIWRFEKDLP
jgi:GNAT superfamily N-acetyltransferase